MSIQRSWTGKVFIATSLDGLIARPDGDISWLTDPPVNSHHVAGESGGNPPPDYDAFIAGVDHLVMGRGTYEKVLTFGFWPYEKLEVLVLSTTLPEGADSNVTVVRSVDDVSKVLAANGAAGVYVDGGRVIQTFLAHDLIDEITLSTAPILIGAGPPLFGTLEQDIRLTHVGTSTSDSGMTSSRYSVIR
ncbi:MAG: dihydrofolate reductase family protein [Aeromicrobium sp.]